MGGILGGARNAAGTTEIDVEKNLGEDVIRFITQSKQRMAIFNGGTSGFGEISDSTSVVGNISGYEGGVAIGNEFNRPEASLHIKGNLVVSSNVNISGDYFKVNTINPDNDSINLTTTGGMTVDVSDSINEVINNDKLITIGANLNQTITGNKTVIVTGNVSEIVEGSKNIHISGYKNLTVTGISNETYKSNRTINITGNYAEIITGTNTLTVNKDVTELIKNKKDLTISKNANITIMGNNIL